MSKQPAVPRPIPYIAPLALFLVLGQLESALVPEQRTELYPTIYAGKVFAVMAALAFAWPALRTLNWKLPTSTWTVGLVGGVLWLLLAVPHLEWSVLRQLGQDSWLESVRRVEFDPMASLDGMRLVGFLTIRLVGLVLVVPLAEELFLRGFLLRFISDERWWELPVGVLTRTAILMGTFYGVFTHPAELLAAGCWFSLITWLSIRTKSFGACVVAHALANALLAAYVLITRDWTLW